MPKNSLLSTTDTPFAHQLLKWFDKHGRKNLPWQQGITPYRVWLSEIMLQQTQVETVIPYFERFTKAYPDFLSLATAKQDDVLHLWTGLGYYARARNLHKCAQSVMENYNGEMPSTVDELITLPGIGRSTAGAISSIAFKQTATILDGNVKRVLTRYYAIAGWPGTKPIENTLWEKAELNTPTNRTNDYTQAIMDLGATLCTRSKPDCQACPMEKSCQARKQGNPKDYPGKKPKKDKPTKYTQMLIVQSPNGELLLRQRPQSGIWGGLWSFEELEQSVDASDHLHTQYKHIDRIEHWPSFNHVFSHYTLVITPVFTVLKKLPHEVREPNGELWYNLAEPKQVGLAAPVKKLLQRVAALTEDFQLT